MWSLSCGFLLTILLLSCPRLIVAKGHDVAGSSPVCSVLQRTHIGPSDLQCIMQVAGQYDARRNVSQIPAVDETLLITTGEDCLTEKFNARQKSIQLTLVYLKRLLTQQKQLPPSSLNLLVEIGADFINQCQPPLKQQELLVSLLRQSLTIACGYQKTLMERIIRALSRQSTCQVVRLQDFIDSADKHIFEKLIVDFRKSLMFQEPNVLRVMVEQLHSLSMKVETYETHVRFALFKASLSLLAIDWVPSASLDRLFSAMLVFYKSQTVKLDETDIPLLLAIHSRHYYLSLCKNSKLEFERLLLLVIKQSTIDKDVLSSMDMFFLSPCRASEVIQTLFKLLANPFVSTNTRLKLECFILYIMGDNPKIPTFPSEVLPTEAPEAIICVGEEHCQTEQIQNTATTAETDTSAAGRSTLFKDTNTPMETNEYSRVTTMSHFTQTHTGSTAPHGSSTPHGFTETPITEPEEMSTAEEPHTVSFNTENLANGGTTPGVTENATFPEETTTMRQFSYPQTTETPGETLQTEMTAIHRSTGLVHSTEETKTSSSENAEALQTTVTAPSTVTEITEMYGTISSQTTNAPIVTEPTEITETEIMTTGVQTKATSENPEITTMPATTEEFTLTPPIDTEDVTEPPSLITTMTYITPKSDKLKIKFNVERVSHKLTIKPEEESNLRSSVAQYLQLEITNSSQVEQFINNTAEIRKKPGMWVPLRRKIIKAIVDISWKNNTDQKLLLHSIIELLVNDTEITKEDFLNILKINFNPEMKAELLKVLIKYNLQTMSIEVRVYLLPLITFFSFQSDHQSVFMFLKGFMTNINTIQITVEIRHMVLQLIEYLLSVHELPEDVRTIVMEWFQFMVQGVQRPNEEQYTIVARFIGQPQQTLHIAIIESIPFNEYGRPPAIAIDILKTIIEKLADQNPTEDNRHLVPILIRFVVTQNIPAEEMLTVLALLDSLMRNPNVIVPSIRLTVLVDLLTLTQRSWYRHYLPKGRKQPWYLTLVDNRMDDVVVEVLIKTSWSLPQRVESVITLTGEAKHLALEGKQLTDVDALVISIGAPVLSQPESANITEIVRQTAEYLQTDSSYKLPSLLRRIISMILSNQPLDSSIQANITVTSYVDWPSTQLPKRLFEDIGQDIDVMDAEQFEYLVNSVSDIMTDSLEDARIRGAMMAIGVQLLSTDQMTVSLGAKVMEALKAAIPIRPALWKKVREVLIMEIPDAITSSTVRSLKSEDTQFLLQFLEFLLKRAKRVGKSTIDEILSMRVSPEEIYALYEVLQPLTLQPEFSHEQKLKLARELAEMIRIRVGPKYPTSAIKLLEKFRELVQRVVGMESIVKLIDGIIASLRQRITTNVTTTSPEFLADATKNTIRRFLLTEIPRLNVSTYTALYVTFSNWNQEDSGLLVRNTTLALQHMDHYHLNDLYILALEVVSLFNSSNSVGSVAELLARMTQPLIEPPYKLTTLTHLLAIVSHKNRENVALTTDDLLARIQALFDSGPITVTKPEAVAFVIAASAFTDNKDILHSMPMRYRKALSDLIGYVHIKELPDFLSAEIIRTLNNPREAVLVKHVAKQSDETTMKEFLGYLLKAHPSEKVSLDDETMASLEAHMQSLSTTALTNIVEGVEQVYNVNPQIIKGKLKHQLTLIIELGKRNQNFPSHLVDKSNQLIEKIKLIPEPTEQPDNKRIVISKQRRR